MTAADRNPVLPADKGESLSEFQKKGLEVVDYLLFKIAFEVFFFLW